MTCQGFCATMGPISLGQTVAKTKTRSTATKTSSRRAASSGAKPAAAKGGVAASIPPHTWRGIRYLGVAAMGGFTLLALSSYVPTDPSFFHRSSTSDVANWCGRWGAMLSDLLYQGLGYAAWGLVPGLLWLLMRFLRRPSATWVKLGIGTLATWWAATFMGLLEAGGDSTRGFPAGGWLGQTSALWMLDVVGAVGSYVLVVVLLLAAATVVFGINWESLAGKGVRAVEGQAPVVKEGAAGLASGVGDLFMRGRGWIADRIKGPEPRVERWEEGPEPPQPKMPRRPEEREARSVHEAARPSVVDAPPSLPGVAIPIDRPEPVVTLEGGLTGIRFDAEAPMEPEDRTQVAAREVVEVEYEPTGVSTPATPLAELEDAFESEASSARAEARPRVRREPVRRSEPGPRTQARAAGMAPSLYEVPRADTPPRSANTPRPTPAPYVGERDMGDGSVYAEPERRPAPSAAQDLPEPQFLTPEPAAPPVQEVEEEVVVAEDHEVVILPDPPAVEDLPEAHGLDEDMLDEGDDGDLADAPQSQPFADKRPPERRIPKVKTKGQPLSGDPTFGPTIEAGDLSSGGEEDGDDLVISRPAEPEIVYELPSLGLLDKHNRSVGQLDEGALKAQAAALVQKLDDFKIKGEVTAIRPGPVITIFEYLPAPGVKVSRIAGLTDDIAMAMRALRVRIVAPIPGKGVVGIEIPNKQRQTVWYRDMMASKEYREKDWLLPMALGKTPAGKPYFGDLAKMPHLLVGGTTGSGKSVGVNAMLMTMLYHRTPETLRMILIDPKMLEFELYNDIPHLLHPVVTEPKLANAALKWACNEMDERYRMLARWGTRNIENYNAKLERELKDWTPQKARRYAPRGFPKDETPPKPQKLPYIVIVIDELADLMMVASKEVEESIVRLAQKARACGIHLIVATQRPSVDVITGLIKANMPSRIAFQVRSKTDGRTILDQNGAETLLGKGDMLLLPPGVSALQRLHGPFVSDDEAGRVCDYWREQGEPSYDAQIRVEEDEGLGDVGEDEYDDCYDLAVQIVAEAGKASTSMIQRRLKIGYNRAARIMDMMERDGVVGPADGARPRKVLVDPIEA